MPLSISEVGQRVGLQPSAIRYYEQIGLLPPTLRINGQRSYDATVFHRLALVQRAQRLGFTLGEIRQLFFGFRQGMPASQRWRKLSRRKLDELDIQLRDIKAMQRRLREMIRKCRCETFDQCGKGIFSNECAKNSTGRARTSHKMKTAKLVDASGPRRSLLRISRARLVSHEDKVR
jgi:MerR family transcriptional regulator, redox-sensitive transcriptional activator SoxR